MPNDTTHHTDREEGSTPSGSVSNAVLALRKGRCVHGDASGTGRLSIYDGEIFYD